MPDSKALGQVKSRLKAPGMNCPASTKFWTKYARSIVPLVKPANHTHRECWVFKQSGKLNAVHKGEDTPREDEDEPPNQDTREQKKFPLEVTTVNVLHMIKGKNNAAPPGKYTQVPVTAKSCHWSSQPITFDHRDYSASI